MVAPASGSVPGRGVAGRNARSNAARIDRVGLDGNVTVRVVISPPVGSVPIGRVSACGGDSTRNVYTIRVTSDNGRAVSR